MTVTAMKTATAMKNMLKRLARDEKGQALPLALAMLALGSLAIVPLLSLTSTTLKAGIRAENSMYEQYAANAGVSDGLLNIITDDVQLPAVGENWSYTIPDTNNRNVAVVIASLDSNSWQVASTAGDGGSSTRLNCYLDSQPYLPNAITAASVIVKTNAAVNGDVQYDSALGTLTNNGDIDGNVIDAAVAWPSAAEVGAYYYEQVAEAPLYEGDLNLVLLPQTVSNPYSLGPVFIDGNLTMAAGSEGAVRLDGTVYVTGDVLVGAGVKFRQNGNNIYAEGAGGITFQAGSSLIGSGCTVAQHGIAFSGSTTSESYGVLWALTGTLTANPAGQLYGILCAGEAGTPGTVSLEPSETLNYVAPARDLPMPPLPENRYFIVGWENGG